MQDTPHPDAPPEQPATPTEPAQPSQPAEPTVPPAEAPMPGGDVDVPAPGTTNSYAYGQSPSSPR